MVHDLIPNLYYINNHFGRETIWYISHIIMKIWLCWMNIGGDNKKTCVVPKQGSIMKQQTLWDQCFRTQTASLVPWMKTAIMVSWMSQPILMGTLSKCNTIRFGPQRQYQQQQQSPPRSPQSSLKENLPQSPTYEYQSWASYTNPSAANLNC